MTTYAQMIDAPGSNAKRSSSWLTARSSERAAASLVASDPKFKKYMQQVEKCLASFDNVHEWADFISFLTKLLKTFQSYMQFKEIPRKLIVSKRLAQCLNPALPTGVHQRALDVYAHILAILGIEGLKRDLQLWSSGLFPFFEYASTAVKPTLLNLYDTYYLPLNQSLRPIMKSFILALLPGLEETTGEFFDKVMHLLERLSRTVSLAFFLQNLWLVMLTTPSARGSAINYLSRKLPSLEGQEDVTQIVGRDIGLMIRAFSAALEDDNLFVQRAILDLLLQSLRIDSGVVKRAQGEDRTILMTAATGVVLRRDSSLNRRLHTWLLGPEEHTQAQEAYFREHSLELLCTTLREEMYMNVRSNALDARPYKIFLSLLDKAEIGSPLTDALILDALKAIKLSFRPEENGGADIQIAASGLYSFVELHTVWKHLFKTVCSELLGNTGKSEAVHLMRFVIATFRAHEEEVQQLHLPLIFSAISEIIKDTLTRDPTKVSELSTQETLQLLLDMLPVMAPSALILLPELRESSSGDFKNGSPGPHALACRFYGIEHVPASNATTYVASPFVNVYQDFVFITTCCSRGLSVASPSAVASQTSFLLAMNIMSDLVTKVQEQQALPLKVGWKPIEWLFSILASLDHTSSFAVLDKIVNLCVVLGGSIIIEPRLSIDDRPTLLKIVTALFRYLDLQCAPYHVRAVHHIWVLARFTTHNHVESILASILTSPPTPSIRDPYEAFGVFWRLSDDTDMPGFLFKTPMLIVLDTLKSEDPHLRRTGETWMRCSLKSYLRVLDPVFYNLLDPSVRRLPVTLTLEGREVQSFEYERPFDQMQTIYLLDTLLSVIRFGGQGFVKVARTNSIKRSHSPSLVERVEQAKFIQADPTYMEVFVEILHRVLQTEPKTSLTLTMGPANIRLQAVSTDIIQAVVSRGEVDLAMLESLERSIITKLYICTHADRLDLQNKLLHVLHSIMFASTTVVDARSKSENAMSDAGTATDDGSEDTRKQAHGAVNPLLAQTLIDGISKTTKRPTLQHWLDFALMIIPQFQKSLYSLIFPLSDCICRQLRQALADVERISSHDYKGSTNILSETTDAEFMMLLNSLERLVLISLTRSSDGSSAEEDGPFQERTGESGGLLGYVSNVFSSDTSETLAPETLSPRSPAYRCLHEAVTVLYTLWVSSAWTPPEFIGAESDSLALIYSRSRLRCRRVLERLFRAQSGEVMESIIECWFWASKKANSRNSGTFEIIDLLASSAQTVVHMLCESISIRMSPFPEKTKRLALNPNLTDSILFNFLEEYLSRLEGPIAIQVWARCMALAKDVVGNIYGYKLQIFPVLRCIVVLSEIITRTTALEDRRIRRELQEIFTKLVDSCVLIAGRSFEQGNWIRRGAKDSLATPTATNGRNSPLPRTQADSTPDEKGIPTEDFAKLAWGIDLIDQINQFIAAKILPNVRRFLVDGDKVASVCTNIIYYVVNPAMKVRASRTLDVEDYVLDIIKEMIKIPVAAKSWKGPVVEAFNDPRFFNGSAESNVQWRPLVRGLMDSDKQVFMELIGRVTTASSANIFTNREHEMFMRSLNLRRLSYVVFTGDKNQFLAQLPSIQEKLVEILRNVNSAVIHSEVYLCMRVLLCRLSPHNLSSFWPVILTELFRLFEQVIVEPPADGSEELQLVLAACKFLDLVLVLQTQEFQIHQWMFVTDTVDAVYRPENWYPESIMDQLAEIIRDLPDTKNLSGKSSDLNEDPYTSRTDSGLSSRSRRPLLLSVRQIHTIKDLIPFFSHVSIVSYESVYAIGSVDWEAVEAGLIGEMFEGDESTLSSDI